MGNVFYYVLQIDKIVNVRVGVFEVFKEGLKVRITFSLAMIFLLSKGFT